MGTKYIDCKKDLLNELITVGKNKLLESLLKEKKKAFVPSEQLLLLAKAYLKFAIEEKALFNLKKLVDYLKKIKFLLIRY